MLAVTSSNACAVPSSRRACGCLDVRLGRSFLLDSRTSTPPTLLPHIPDIVACMCLHPSKRWMSPMICAEVPDRENATLLFCCILSTIQGKETQPRFRATSLSLWYYCPASAGSRERDEDVSDLSWLLGAVAARYRFSSGNDRVLLTSRCCGSGGAERSSFFLDL